MGENTWTHLGILAVPALMIIGFWFEARRSRDQQHRERVKQYQDITERLTKIETMLEPLWKQYNESGTR